MDEPPGDAMTAAYKQVSIMSLHLAGQQVLSPHGSEYLMLFNTLALQCLACHHSAMATRMQKGGVMNSMVATTHARRQEWTNPSEWHLKPISAVSMAA